MGNQAKKIAEVISSYHKVHFTYLTDEHTRQRAQQTIQITIEKYINKFPNQPLRFILPGFPFKFPIRTLYGYNIKHKQTIDAADYFAIMQLETFINEIYNVYKPGVHVDIIMDAEGFNKLENIPDTAISQYKRELEDMIKKLHLDKNIHLLRYATVNPVEEFSLYQQRVISTLEDYIKNNRGTKDDNFLRRYIGLSEYQRKQLHHLLSIDDEYLSNILIRRKRRLKNRLKKTVKESAYHHLWYQDTWRHIVSEFFPDHIRLTVHPQSPDSDKIGFYLSDKSNMFAPVPWQGVPLRIISTKRTTIDMIIDYQELLQLDTVIPLTYIYFARIDCRLPCFIIDTTRRTHTMNSTMYTKMMENLYLKRTRGLQLIK